NFMLKYDIICLTETKLDDFDNADVSDFKFQGVHRIGGLKKSGGIDYLWKYVKFVDCNNENCLWFEFDSKLSNEKCMFGVIYIPPENFVYSSVEIFDKLESDIIDFKAEAPCIQFVLRSARAQRHVTSRGTDHVMVHVTEPVSTHVTSVWTVCDTTAPPKLGRRGLPLREVEDIRFLPDDGPQPTVRLVPRMQLERHSAVSAVFVFLRKTGKNNNGMFHRRFHSFRHVRMFAELGDVNPNRIPFRTEDSRHVCCSSFDLNLHAILSSVANLDARITYRHSSCVDVFDLCLSVIFSPLPHPLKLLPRPLPVLSLSGKSSNWKAARRAIVNGGLPADLYGHIKSVGDKGGEVKTRLHLQARQLVLSHHVDKS
ncbi:hypothetical protein MAR_022175, partial [Mya arenaria]